MESKKGVKYPYKVVDAWAQPAEQSFLDIVPEVAHLLQKSKSTKNFPPSPDQKFKHHLDLMNIAGLD